MKDNIDALLNTSSGTKQVHNIKNNYAASVVSLGCEFTLGKMKFLGLIFLIRNYWYEKVSEYCLNPFSFLAYLYILFYDSMKFKI